MPSDQPYDDDDTVRVPPQSAWGIAVGLPPVRHDYPLAVRNPSLFTALGLLMRTLPYAIARFALLLATTVCVIIWLAVVFGPAVWLGEHVAAAFFWVWVVGWLFLGGFFWATVVRYVLHLIECGHVAIVTELVTTGAVANGRESMFSYGKRIVLARIGQESLLFGLNALVRGAVESFHRTMDWIADLFPIEGLESISTIINILLKAATRYLDKVIFSYTLARGDKDVWRANKEGMIYYAQNARPVLKTAAWSALLERLLTIVLFVGLLVPAAFITVALPQGIREFGGAMTVVVAILLAGPLRAAFIKPLFLIMMIVRFHACIEGQAIGEAWEARLSSVSDKFSNLGANAAAAMGRSRFSRMWW